MSVIAPLRRPADPGRPPGPDPDPDRRLLARARRRITFQVAGAFSVVLALVGVLVWCAMVHSQGTAALRDLTVTAARSPVAYPPPCVWLYELRADGTIAASPGAPAELPVRSSLNHVAGGGESKETVEVTVAGQEYLVHTRRRGDTVVQAALDLRYQVSERQRLLHTLIGAEVAGLLAALVVGHVVSRRAIAPLGEALARQRRFAADVSHELRSPLQTLAAAASVLTRRSERHDDRTATAARLVAEEVSRFQRLVDDLIELARTEQPAQRELVDVATLARETCRARGLPDGLVSVVAGSTAEWLVDRRRVEQILLNLLDNAIRYGGGPVAVRLSTRPPDTGVLEVDDAGPGVSAADREVIFDRFVRGRAARSRAGTDGTGLGLALVAQHAAAHGGRAGVDDRPGGGARFRVELPEALP